ncbi:GNAT family N-acetyltransferase [Delftia acidovorans]|uniref:GNAT family N-acetyltransferase n=1 Tax=Delftia acidovorans TaxID=80866 RepID=UPI001E54D57E|nr:GNAT family N-acetyltransferase [Delftia acidovorans]
MSGTMVCDLPLIRRYAPADLRGAYELLISNGWGHRIASQDYLERLIGASQAVEVAVAGNKVVGFARAITDGLSNGYLSMVVVAPGYRGQGIGRRLVEAVTGADPGITWVLRAGREQAPQFFARLGFVASEEAMERRRACGT